MRLSTVLAGCLLAIAPSAVWAADLAGLINTTPVFTTATVKRMYDLERCMIEVDAPIMPHVYRQPDQPERVMLVWDGGNSIGGVSAAAKIEGVDNARITFWGREKILRRIKPCLEITDRG